MLKILEQEIITIQKDYLKLLKELLKASDTKNIIKTLSYFWYSHHKSITLYLKAISEDVETYVFTDANFSINNNDIYPLLAIGNKHLIAEPIFQLLETSSYPDIDDKISIFAHLTTVVIKLHIDIMEKYGHYIHILPMRFGLSADYNEIRKTGLKIFFSLFKEEYYTLEEYITKIKTKADVYKGLKDAYKRIPHIFSDEIFQNSANKDILPTLSNESFIFFHYTVTRWEQAYIIACNFLDSGVIPFIKDPAIFFHTLNILPMFNISNTDDYLYKITYPHILFHMFPEELSNIQFDRYRQTIKKLSIISKFDNQTRNESEEYSPEAIESEVLKHIKKLKLEFGIPILI